MLFTSCNRIKDDGHTYNIFRLHDYVRKKIHLFGMENLEDSLVKETSIEGKQHKVKGKIDLHNKPGLRSSKKANKTETGATTKKDICTHCRKRGHNPNKC